MKSKYLILFVLSILFLWSCSDEKYYPKPRAYFRIKLPPKTYQSFDSTYPYRFEYPSYGKIFFDNRHPNEKYWMNLYFPLFHSTVYFSYKTVDNNLETYINDAHSLVSKLIPKADAIKQNVYDDPSKKVYGNVYNIEGSKAASVLQFYLTDSSRHFVRGALYFNNPPNNDSLQPVIDFLKEDIQHIIESFQWKSIR
jgi:gliding motility-associated lipoprotein GldD